MSEFPHFTVPIVGREREIDEIAARIHESRVVTIAGPGGLGKTRLAVEVAAGLAPTEPEGVWFADLAPISDPDLVAATVATAVGLEVPPAADPVATLTSALGSQRMTIVFDNCEQVVAAAARLADVLIAACPNVRIIATSREPLGIAAEDRYRLGTLSENAAVELFTMHARFADAQFELTPRAEPVVRDICVRLDGIPLAIQLAAACVRSMSLGQLRSRLDGRFRLLVGESRVALPRHKTMQALIDWSYDLLTENERTVFRRLGVFNGGFSLDAAARVAGGSAVPASEIPGIVAALEQKSMIVLTGDGGPRYTMLESMRQYAIQRLNDAEETEAVRRAHAEFALARSAHAERSFGTGSEEAWVSDYIRDVDNFRAALDWARQADVELAARIASNLADFWEFSTLTGEGLRRLEAIFAAIPDPDGASALPLLLAIARVAQPAHVYRRSLDTADRALALAQRDGNEAAAAEARRVSGRARYLLGYEYERGLRDLADALVYIREHGKPLEVARAMRDYASALAMTDAVRGGELLLEALERAHALNWPTLWLHVEINVAEREFRSGNGGRAAQRLRHVISLLRARRVPHQLGHALTNLSSYLVTSGEYEEALAAAREAIAIGRAGDTPNYVAIPLQAVAVVLAIRGNAIDAARLLGYVEGFYSDFAMKPEPTEAIVQARLRQLLAEGLDPAAQAEQAGAGRMLTEAQACALIP